MGDDTEEYIRVRRAPKATLIEVEWLIWRGPHSPESCWRIATRLPLDAPPHEVHQAVREAYANERFFRTCSICGERCLVGHLIRPSGQGEVCHTCAERHLGVVF